MEPRSRFTFKMKKLIIPLLACLSLVSCAKEPTEYKAFSNGLFDTYVDIKTYEGNDTNTQELLDILKQFSKETDNYINTDTNGVYKINLTNNSVQISDNLYQCLKYADKLSDDLGTYFSICLGSLSKLWKSKLNESKIPTSEEIQSELLKIQETSLNFEDNSYVNRVGQAEIDLGAIAKGYGLELCKTFLKSNNISKYLIDAGRSSILLGEKPTEDGEFTIKIKSLQNAYIKAKNITVSTSSIDEQTYVVDGVRYSHIISPETGDAKTINDTCIVLSENSALGDALSTSLMQMSLPEIMSIENEYNVQTLIIKDHKILYQNPNIKLIYG